MTVTGGDPADEGTRFDRQPPSFPQVGDSPASSTPANTQSLFASPETSPIETKPISPAPASQGGGRGGRLRWLVAGVATIVVIAIVGGVLFLAAPRPGTPSPLAH